MTAVFNIGYSGWAGTKVLSLFPVCYENITVNDFVVNIREQVEVLASWADYHVVPRSMLCLFVHFEYDDKVWDFKLMMNNVREYKQLNNN